MSDHGIRCGNCSTFGQPVYHADVAAIRECSVRRNKPASGLTKTAEKTSSFQDAIATIPVGSAGYGYYALEIDGTVKFYRVERPTKGKWAGRTFVKAQASDDFHQIERGPAFGILTLIAQDPDAAAALYGKTLGRCSSCHKLLTDAESIAVGRGPDCRKKLGAA
jgi:hypothetical protein